jgi:hypothetical protein
MGYFERSPTWQSVLSRLVIIGSLLVLASALLFVPVTIVQVLGLGSLMPSLGGLYSLPAWWTLVPAAALPLLAAIAYGLFSKSPEPLSEVNATTLTLFAVSALFPIVAALVVGNAALEALDANVGLLLRAHLILVALAGIVLTIFAWLAHWVAVRTWAW